jgi:hypothetical protein
VAKEGQRELILFGKDVPQAELQLVEHRFQLVEGQSMLAMLNSIKGLMRQASFPCELSVGKATAPLSQKSCQVPVEIPLHGGNLANIASRMRDAFNFTKLRNSCQIYASVKTVDELRLLRAWGNSQCCARRRGSYGHFQGEHSSPLVEFFDTEKPLEGNPIRLRKSENFLASRQIAGSFPSRQGCPGNACHLGCLVLSQARLLTEVMQPCSVRISPSFWCSTHAAASINGRFEATGILSKVRQNDLFLLTS